jgi:pimeloyl-ACP methyl ester carboxylesterase
MDKSDDNLRVEWLRGFFAGQKAIGAEGLIPESDLAFAFYKDIYRYRGKPFSTYTCPDVAARRLSPDPRVGICAPLARQQKVRGRRGGQLLLLPLRDAFTYLETWQPALAERVGAGDVRAWRKRGAKYGATRRVLDEAMRIDGNRPLIIVAHSMGGLVTYDYLVRRPAGERPEDAPRISRLITLGTQVGNPFYAKRLDTTKLVPHAYPRSVGDWINIHDREDPLGFALYDWHGKMLFERGNTPHQPTDLTVNISSRYHHQIDAYLQHRYVARAITAAWCAGSGREATASDNAASMDACDHVRDVVSERDEPYRESGVKKAQHFIKLAAWMGLGYRAGAVADRGRSGEDNTWRLVGTVTGAFVPTIASAIFR